ncbi:hypothetical protein ACQJBY_021155 [Aegilops geniculata]
MSSSARHLSHHVEVASGRRSHHSFLSRLSSSRLGVGESRGSRRIRGLRARWRASPVAAATCRPRATAGALDLIQPNGLVPSGEREREGRRGGRKRGTRRGRCSGGWESITDHRISPPPPPPLTSGQRCRLHPRNIFVTRSCLLPHPSSSRTATKGGPLREY